MSRAMESKCHLFARSICVSFLTRWTMIVTWCRHPLQPEVHVEAASTAVQEVREIGTLCKKEGGEGTLGVMAISWMAHGHASAPTGHQEGQHGRCKDLRGGTCGVAAPLPYDALLTANVFALSRRRTPSVRRTRPSTTSDCHRVSMR